MAGRPTRNNIQKMSSHQHHYHCRYHHYDHLEHRRQRGSVGAASEKTVLLFSQKRVAITGMMMVLVMVMRMMVLVRSRMVTMMKLLGHRSTHFKNGTTQGWKLLQARRHRLCQLWDLPAKKVILTNLNDARLALVGGSKIENIFISSDGWKLKTPWFEF